MAKRNGVMMARTGMRSWIWFRAVLLSALFCCSGTSWGELPTQAVVDVTYINGKLNIKVVDAPLSELLREIGRQSQIDISLTGEFEERVTRTFVDVALSDAIRRLIQTGGMVILHDPAYRDTPSEGITEIWLYRRTLDVASSMFFAHQLEIKPQDSRAENAAEHGQTEKINETQRLVNALSEIHRDKRIELIREYSRSDDPKAIAILGEILAVDADVDIRMEAVKALRHIGNNQALISLEKGLGNDHFETRFEVVEAIGAVGGDRATLNLGQVLFGEEDPEIRRLAVEYLSQQPSEAATSFLKAATDDASEIVHDAALNALEIR